MGAAVLGGAGGFGGRGAGVWLGSCGVKTGFFSGLRRLLGRGCRAAGVVLRALGGVWSACWGLVGVVGSYGRVLKCSAGGAERA